MADMLDEVQDAYKKLKGFQFDREKGAETLGSQLRLRRGPHGRADRLSVRVSIDARSDAQGTAAEGTARQWLEARLDLDAVGRYHRQEDGEKLGETA